MRNLMRCVPRVLTYVQYASHPCALRIRTRVYEGRNLVRCVPGRLTYHVYASPPGALRTRTRVLMGGT